MQLGIIGLARSGKTTIFNAVTRGTAAVGTYSSSSQPNVGVVNVPDERVDRLTELYKPKKVTYATIQYVDFPQPGNRSARAKARPASSSTNSAAWTRSSTSCASSTTTPCPTRK
jgi:ribosome-binding ATPase